MEDLNSIRTSLIAFTIEDIVEREHKSPFNLNLLTSDGRWSDIDYTNEDGSYWKPIHHLFRLRSLCADYRREAFHGYAKDDFKRLLHRILNAWFREGLRGPTWWWVDIGVPLEIGPILIMLESELTEDERAAGLKLLEHLKIEKTGQNLIWLSR